MSKIQPYQNVAYGTIQIGNINKKVLAISSAEVNLPSHLRDFEVLHPNDFQGPPQFEGRRLQGELSPREHDAEFRIVEYTARKIRQMFGEQMSQAKGSLELFSERAICEVCEEVILQFQLRFPQIELKYNAGPYIP